MENSEIASIFQQIGDLLEIRGDNPFRVRSYRNAAETLDALAGNLEEMVHEGRDLRDIPGIGQGISKKIIEIVTSGDCDEHRKLLEEIPHTLLELLKISGMGPKKIGVLFKQLSITNLEQLEKAAMARKIRELPGMGAKSEEKILKGIEALKKVAGRNLLSTVWRVAEELRPYLEACPQIKKLEFAGSFRRRRETVGDLDVLVSGSPADPIMQRFVTYPQVVDVLAQGETKASVRFASGLQVDLRVLQPESFGAALQYFTGSQGHNIALRDRAKRQGLKVNEYGVFRSDSEKMVAGATEEEVYQALGLTYIPPELRENRGEIESAEKSDLPELLERRHIRGDLHMHTRESDGKCRLEELVGRAEQLDYEYIAITDHSKSVFVANGLDEKRLLRQMKLIDQFNRDYGGRLRVLKGCEVDIKGDGSLDLDEEVLSKLDIVIVSVHSSMQMPREQMTDRIIAAFSRPCVKIFAHPTGRILLRREPYAVDLERLIEAAATHGVFLEINAYPGRLDLNGTHSQLVKTRGLRVVINTDTHGLEQMDNMRYGVYTARRGWLEKGDVLNTLPLADFQSALLN